MTATGWCDDCGDVEVQPEVQLRLTGGWVDDSTMTYADCPLCGADVDQWAWS